MNWYRSAVLIILGIGLFFCSCDSAIKNDVYTYLKNLADDRLTMIGKEISKYEMEAKQLDYYKSQIQTLKAKVVDLTGYWQYTSRGMYNLCTVPSNKGTGSIGSSVFEAKITGTHITGNLAALKQIQDYDIKQQIAQQCSQASYKLKKDVAVIGIILANLDSYHNSWSVSEFNSETLIVEGESLGFDDTGAAKGQWTYQKNTKTSNPYDANAKKLSEKLSGNFASFNTSITEFSKNVNKKPFELAATKNCANSGWNFQRGGIYVELTGTDKTKWRYYNHVISAYEESVSYIYALLEMGYRVYFCGLGNYGINFEVLQR